MSYKTWIDLLVKKLTGFDIGWIKLSVFAFALMIAKLWEPILSLQWYWYGIICVLAAIKPIYSVYLKKVDKSPLKDYNCSQKGIQ